MRVHVCVCACVRACVCVCVCPRARVKRIVVSIFLPCRYVTWSNKEIFKNLKEMERRERNRKDLFIFSPLPLIKGCRWMTYHLMVHTSSVLEKGSQQTTMHLHQGRKMHATQHKSFVQTDEHVFHNIFITGCQQQAWL